jgi:hypothetical protein
MEEYKLYLLDDSVYRYATEMRYNLLDNNGNLQDACRRCIIKYND